MPEHRLGLAVRLTQAIIITAFVGAISVGAIADPKNDKPKDRDSRGAAEHKVDTRKTGAAQHRVDTRDNKGQGSEWWRARPGTRDNSRTPGGSEWWRAKPGTGSQGRYPDRDDKYRPGQMPGRDYPRYDGRHDRDRDHGRHVPVGSYHKYEPPTRRDGRYYYSEWKTKPLHYGHWVFHNHGSDFCRRSIYFHLGFYPYVRVTRIHTFPYTPASYGRVVIDSGRHLSRDDLRELEEALDDIRNAWLDSRPSLIERRVSRSAQIAVLLDGRYDYSLYADDYIEMTEDVIDEVHTLSFTWERVKLRTDGDYTAFGRHVFRDDYGFTQTVYVSYTLREAGHGFIITEVGSSRTPLL